MRRKIGLILVMVIIFTGCSPQKTEEEKKAEIREELERESAQNEIELNGTKENTKMVDDTLNEDKALVLKGKLILTGTELGHGILLDRENNIDGKLVKQVYFKEKSSVLDFIPRKYFTFYFEGRNSLKEELSGKIPIEIKVNPDSFIYESDRNIGWVDVVEVISADGESNPVDKSKEEYPDKYYMDIFNVYTYMYSGAQEPDIRDTEIYKSGGEFKEAVDKLMDRGYFIEMEEGKYYINDTKQNYRDESDDNNLDKNENNGDDFSYYDPANIKVGQNIGGLKVTNIDYVKGQKLILELKGNAVTKGVITGYYNEMYGENEFVFTPKSKTIDKPIEYAFNSGFQNSITNFEGKFNVDGLLDLQTQNYILEGNELSVKATITGFRLAEKDETSGGISVDVSNYEIIPDEKYIGYVEGENGKKPSLQNETFTTTNQGDFYVDYTNYKCVIIPMHDTINNSKTDAISVDFDGDNTKKLKFTVFGEIQDVKINYVANMGDEGKWKELGTISNSTVEISASLPNDMSSIIVYGKYHEGEGYYKDIKFSLDDMRDLTAYDIIMFQ